MPEAPEVGGPEWSRLVTASKAAAIIGVSPWESPYSCWMQMKGLATREQNDAMRRGNYLEPAILSWFRDRHALLPNEFWREQVWHEHEDWAGATVDAEFQGVDGLLIVEAKSAARMDEWGDPGTDVIPAYYLAQVYFQLAVTGAARCYIPVIGPFLEFTEYVVEADEEFQADILARCKAFHDSLDGDVPPDLDASVATYDIVRRLHPDIDKGEAVEIDEDAAIAYIRASLDLKELTVAERTQKTWLLDQMGRAQYATCNGVTVARRQPNKYGVSLVPVAKDTNDFMKGTAA